MNPAIIAVPFFAVLAVVVFRVWGLAGSAVLIALLFVFYGYFWLKVRRHSEELTRRLNAMSDAEIHAALAQMEASDKEEVLNHLKTMGRRVD